MDLLQAYSLSCPYCGETIEIVIDCSIPSQNYIEDCQVCCRPINFSIPYVHEKLHVLAADENE